MVRLGAFLENLIVTVITDKTIFSYWSSYGAIANLSLACSCLGTHSGAMSPVLSWSHGFVPVCPEQYPQLEQAGAGRTSALTIYVRRMRSESG